jgi:hypothetical protein
MHEGYKWKFGLEFNSLKEFREAVREWSALKGLPVDWVKNSQKMLNRRTRNDWERKKEETMGKERKKKR